MRRRFTRRRRSEEGSGTPIDPGLWQTVRESGVLPDLEPTPVAEPPVDASFALLATAEDAAAGATWRIAASPRSGVDAVLAAGAWPAESTEAGSLRRAAVAPRFEPAARRLHAALTTEGGMIQLLEVPALAPGPWLPQQTPPLVPADHVVRAAGGVPQRALAKSAVEALRGLAAKHRGAVRGVGETV